MIRKQPEGKKKKKIDPYVLRRWIIIGAIVLTVVLTATNIYLSRQVKIEKAIAEKQMQKEKMGAAVPEAGGETEATLVPEAGGTTSTGIGGDFTGVDQTGSPFTFSDTNGKYRLVFFGFTHCPAICPTSLSTIDAAQAQLGDERQNIPAIFVTVDPKRDTPEVLASYISSFDGPITAVTGTKEQMDQAKSAFKVFASALEAEEDGSYNVDHSAFIYLINPEGTYEKHFRYDEDADVIAKAVRQYL